MVVHEFVFVQLIQPQFRNLRDLLCSCCRSHHPTDRLQDHIAIVAQAGVADDAVRVYVFAMMKTKGGHMLENLPPGNLKTLIYRMVALRSLAPQQYHPN